jgi:anaerobic ribonucleoside-triphosphate reductase activating protein
MLQARPLVGIIRAIRARAEVNVVCYTGYCHEELLSEAEPSRLALLSEIDLLIDGPYVQEQHANLLWRGSTNQRILKLSSRIPEQWDETNVGVGVEFRLETDKRMSFSGVPPVPHFREAFAKLMNLRGISLEDTDEWRAEVDRHRTCGGGADGVVPADDQETRGAGAGATGGDPAGA